MAYQAAHDLPHAVEYYQRVYYQYPSGDAATRAAAALLALRDSMGAAYPAPAPQAMVARANQLLAQREYTRARAEFQSLVPQLNGPERDQARVGIGAADYLNGDVSAAYTLPALAGGLRSGGRCRAPLLSGRMRPQAERRRPDDGGGAETGQAPRIVVALQGAGGRGQSIPGDQPAREIHAALQSRVRDLSGSAAGGFLPLAGGVVGLHPPPA